MRRPAGQILVFALICLFIFWLLNRYLPIGADWHFTFYPTTTSWLSGHPLFAAPSYRMYHAPWTVIFLTPMVWMGERSGEAALILLTICSILAGCRYFSKSLRGIARPLALAFCLVNLHVFDLIIRGQVDLFCILGLLILYVGLRRDSATLVGVGWLMSTRPTGIVLLLIFSLWWAWQRGYLWRALRVTLIGVIASLVVFGPDWPLRYYTAIRFEQVPNPGPWLVTLWHAAEYLHIPALWPSLIALAVVVASLWAVWRFRPDLHTTTALLLAGTAVAMPYMLSYHYVLLLIVAVPLLLSWRLWLALPLYLLTLTPLLRLTYGLDVAWIDLCLPLAIWLILLYRVVTERRATTSQETLAPVLQG